ncbi:hypothetical protein PCANC_22203 [Puccinia coronata f. sp. avenae]|uniref:Uncharacterized protein n=1 Tax=Puccinia coronata f. sp. avenae TaxID=200324 RepID=A0A2N5SJL3_9BASI|nr:hypothetical protein PCANC_22203 [Puccinia coronata f. sp. avenae]
MRPSNSNSGARHQVNRSLIQTQRPGRLATEFELVRDSLGGVRLSLNRMAASNINLDAAIRARFSGSAGDDFIAEAINQVALNHDTAKASASSVPGP